MRAVSRVKLLAFAVACLSCVGSSSDGFAQIASPSQVTPQSLRPSSPTLAPSIALPGQSSLTPPPGSQNLSVLIGDVSIEGQFDELAQATEPLLGQLKGRKLSIADIYSVAGAIEKAYLTAGYVLARISIPPQQLVDNGRLRIVVVDGFIEEIDVRALPDYVQNAVLLRTEFLVGRRHIRLAEIERCLLLAGETPGLKLKSTLARGQSDGGAKLVLDGNFDLLLGSYGADNRQPESLGTWQLRGSATLNSAFGYGEQLYGSVGSSAQLQTVLDGTAPLRVFGGGAVVPLGTDGLTVNPEYTHSITQTKSQPGVPASLGTFDRLAFRLRSPLIWTRLESLNVTGGVEYIRQNLLAPQFAINFYTDEYAALRFGANYAKSLQSGTAAQVGGNVSFGLGGRGLVDVVSSGIPLSRTGATSEFTKFNANGRITQPLVAAMRLDLIAAGQFSMNRAMLRSEQFSLDGPDALSAFSAGALSVDQGAALRAELSRPFSARSFSGYFDAPEGSVAPYIFGSIGQGSLIGATAIEQPFINAGAVGLGVRTSFDAKADFTSFTLGLEIARQFSNVAGAERGWRGNVNTAVSF
jgi:hemolysin activation/secretion protein